MRPLEKNEKCKMRSNVAKKCKMQNAQQCTHWEIRKHSKCAAMRLLEKKLRNAKCAEMWPSKKLRKNENTQQFVHWKKMRNAKCAAMWKKIEKCKMRSNVAIEKIDKN